MRLALAVLLLASAAAAEASTLPVRSRGDRIDPSVLAPLLARGELALLDGDPEGAWQVIMMGIVEAPPEKVFKVVMAVEEYPKFLDTVAATKITERRGPMFSYDWELDVPLLTFAGTRLQRGRSPDLVEVRGLTGSFRGSAERWELMPFDGGKRTLAAFYRTLDVETAGIVLQAMARIEPSFTQAVALGTSYVHLRGLQYKMIGQKPPRPGARKGPVPPFRPLDLDAAKLDLAKIEPLLALGPLALVESWEDGSLRQVSCLSIVDAPRDLVTEIAQAVERYPEFMKNFADHKRTRTSERTWDLEWELEVPFSNLTGTSTMAIQPDGSVEIVNTGGDIPRARFRWELATLGDKKTVPIHYAYSDVRQASLFTRLIIDKQPLFEHGAVIAAAAIAMQAVEARAEGRR